MKLWLLRPVRYDDDAFWHEIHFRVEGNPWAPWYNETFGLVVRAESEADARQLASAKAGQVWLNAKHSSCSELTPDGPTEVIITDVYRA